MEDNKEPVVVGICEDILIELHHRLLVTTEEIDLDTAYADALHPCHLGATSLRLVHKMTGTLGSVVPRAVAVVP